MYRKLPASATSDTVGICAGYAEHTTYRQGGTCLQLPGRQHRLLQAVQVGLERGRVGLGGQQQAAAGHVPLQLAHALVALVAGGALVRVPLSVRLDAVVAELRVVAEALRALVALVDAPLLVLAQVPVELRLRDVGAHAQRALEALVVGVRALVDAEVRVGEEGLGAAGARALEAAARLVVPHVRLEAEPVLADHAALRARVARALVQVAHAVLAQLELAAEGGAALLAHELLVGVRVHVVPQRLLQHTPRVNTLGSSDK